MPFFFAGSRIDPSDPVETTRMQLADAIDMRASCVANADLVGGVLRIRTAPVRHVAPGMRSAPDHSYPGSPTTHDATYWTWRRGSP
jgi:hypothetical protein